MLPDSSTNFIVAMPRQCSPSVPVEDSKSICQKQ